MSLVVFIAAVEGSSVIKEVLFENRHTVERFVKICDDDESLIDFIAADKSISENSLRYAIECKNFKLIEYIIENANIYYVDVAVNEKVSLSC